MCKEELSHLGKYLIMLWIFLCSLLCDLHADQNTYLNKKIRGMESPTASFWMKRAKLDPHLQAGAWQRKNSLERGEKEKALNVTMAAIKIVKLSEFLVNLLLIEILYISNWLEKISLSYIDWNASMSWEVWILERVEGDLGRLVDNWEALALDPLPHGNAGNTLQQGASESTPGQEYEVKWGWAPRK